MLYITGDTHGEFTRFSNRNWPVAKSLTRDDTVIIAGDFGGLWADTPEERYWLKLLSERPFTLCFIDGNHENFDMLSKFPVQTWHGGNVHLTKPNVIHLMRGQIFNICNYRVFTMGGAASHDISDGILDPDSPDFEAQYWRKRVKNQMFRVKGRSWWPEEMPSDEEYQIAAATLNKANWDVDIVVSHCGPTKIAQMLNTGYEPDKLTEFFQSVNDMLTFKHWYFGHYHETKELTGKHTVLYRDILKIPEGGLL